MTMNPIKRYLPSYTELSEEQADQLAQPTCGTRAIRVKPAYRSDHPAALDEFVKGIRELKAGWFGLWNKSPVAAFEIRRPTPDDLRFQFSVPTERMERKVRSHLASEIPGVGFEEGVDSLPVSTSEAVGGGLITPGRRDWYPLQTEFDQPPTNNLAGALHRHAFPSDKVVVQILFQPVTGDPVSQWWRSRRTYQRIGYLRKEKEKLWNSRAPTPREKRQANAVERKAGTARFHVSIRLLLINSKEYTPSRIMELAGAFNTYENADTGQYLNTVTISTLESRIFDFVKTIKQRKFGRWHRRFQASTPELAAILAVPDREQDNISTANP